MKVLVFWKEGGFWHSFKLTTGAITLLKAKTDFRRKGNYSC